MKIAICMSGQIRTGIHASSNIKRFLGELLPMCDFFIHTWNYNSPKGRQSEITEILTDDYINNFLGLYKPKQYKVETFSEYINNNSYNFENYMWHGIGESFSMVDYWNDYTAIVRMRPDIIYPPTRRLSFEIINFLKNENVLYSDVFSNERIDDVFWVLNFLNSRKIIDFCKNRSNQTTLKEFAQKNNIQNKSTYRKYMHYAPYRVESLKYDCMTQFKQFYKTDFFLYSGQSEIILNERFSTGDLADEQQYQ